MRRRDVIALLGASASWPIATRAQPAAMPEVGFISSNSADTAAHLIAAFRRGLSEAGYVEGRNVAISYRWGDGRNEPLPAMAADLVQRRVAVIVAFAPAAVNAAVGATRTTPVVFMTGSDPVDAGLVASLNRPGGNTTGVAMFTSTLMPKRLEILHEAVPAAGRIAMLANPMGPSSQMQIHDATLAAERLGVQIDVVRVTTADEVAAAVESLARTGTGAVLFSADQLFQVLRERLVALAARHAMPALYEYREFADAGGLMSFGPDRAEGFRQLGVYTGRVLDGTNPADLPVVQVTRFQLVVNLRTARTLRLTIPPALLARADEVIE
jgi:putative ABC transport system substrate-binding protein